MELKRSKQEEYTTKILDQLQLLFNEENENRINISELEDNSNAADFFHSLANLAPAVVFSKLTQQNVGTLDFNHIANRLCFQYIIAPEKPETPADKVKTE